MFIDIIDVLVFLTASIRHSIPFKGCEGGEREARSIVSFGNRFKNTSIISLLVINFLMACTVFYVF